MRAFKGALLALAAVTTAAAQSPEIPLGETRLTVHTLVREDVFAGFREDDMERMARAEQNIALLLTQRPEQKGNLLAWRAGLVVHKAVRAHEAGKPDDFARYFKEARDTFADAAKLSSGNDGVLPIIGGTYAVLADRLPQEHRAAAWAQAYDSYSVLWKQQGAGIDRLPLHFKGEVLSGMAQSAQRTGRSEEAAQFVDRMLAVLPNTPYEKLARQWKADPASAATTNLTCKGCHGPGRLSVKLAALSK